MPLQCGQMARLRLSQSGTEKLLKIGLDTVTETLDLKAQANEALNKADFPFKFNIGSEAADISAEIDNLKFNGLKFGNSEVNVDGEKIHVCVPVDELDMSVDAKFDIKGHSTSHNGARAYVDPNSPSKPKVCFNGEIGLDGQISNLVHIENEVPTDIGQETKMAMLDLDLNKADDDEILFTYMSLYFMENNLEMPIKFDWLSRKSWSDVYNLIGDISPENVKNMMDLDMMRNKLKEIKGALPPKPKSNRPEEGLVNYLGNLKVDLNLESNKTAANPEAGYMDKVWKIWEEESQKEEEIAPAEEPAGGLYGLWKKAADSVTGFKDQVVDSVVGFKDRVVESASTLASGVTNQLKYNTEDLIRSRFLPYFQESFNKSVSGSAPVMTALAKTAEKHLIPLAKKKANEAIAKLQNASNFSSITRMSVNRPFINAQDLVDRETLQKIQDQINFSDYTTVSGQLRNIRQYSGNNQEKIVEASENILQNLEHYVQSVSTTSSDKNALSFLKDKVLPYLEQLRANMYFQSGGRIPKSLKDNTLSLIQRTRAKAASVAENINYRNRDLELELSTRWFNEISEGPELTVATEELCAQGVGTLANSSKVTKDEIQAHDLAASLNIDAVNATLDKLTKDGQFDFCLHGKEVQTCSSQNGNYNNRCRFESPPRVTWNSEEGKHQIKLRKLQCETRLINADNNCGVKDQKSGIPVLGFLFNMVAKGAGSICKFASDQADNLVTGSVGQNLVDVTVDLDPKICGSSICMQPTLDDSKIRTDMENVNPNLASMIGKMVGIIASPITDVVKSQIVDDALMTFMEAEVSTPLESPIGIYPKRIISEAGQITVLSDFEPEGELRSFVAGCISGDPNCNSDRFLNIETDERSPSRR